MNKRLFSSIIILCCLFSFTACKKTNNETAETVTVAKNENILYSETDTITATEPETIISSPTPTETPTANNPVISNNESSTAEVTKDSKPSPPPVSNKPSQSATKPPPTHEATTQPPPTVTTPTQPPTSTPTQNNPYPTISLPPTPEYQILGQNFLDGVLNGINERRSALGLRPAKFNRELSNKCVDQAKKMADVGTAFHSETLSGCEGVARVPYNHPADLLGDVMCTHVPNFLDKDRLNVGIGIVKKGNYLYAVIQGVY